MEKKPRNVKDLEAHEWGRSPSFILLLQWGAGFMGPDVTKEEIFRILDQDDQTLLEMCREMDPKFVIEEKEGSVVFDISRKIAVGEATAYYLDLEAQTGNSLTKKITNRAHFYIFLQFTQEPEFSSAEGNFEDLEPVKGLWLLLTYSSLNPNNILNTYTKSQFRFPVGRRDKNARPGAQNVSELCYVFRGDYDDPKLTVQEDDPVPAVQGKILLKVVDLIFTPGIKFDTLREELKKLHVRLPEGYSRKEHEELMTLLKAFEEIEASRIRLETSEQLEKKYNQEIAKISSNNKRELDEKDQVIDKKDQVIDEKNQEIAQLKALLEKQNADRDNSK